MLFKELSIFLERLEKTASRIEITKILAELFKKTPAEEIDKVCYLVLGGLAPSYEGLILNIAEKMMFRVLSKAYHKDISEVIKIYKEKGDLGHVAFSLAKTSVGRLSVTQVHSELMKVAKEGGEGSQERRVEILANLLKSLDPLSSKYASRVPVGRLRLGFSDKTVLDALSWMQERDKSLKPLLEKAFQVLPDVGFLAREVKAKGIKKACKAVIPVVGIPVLPMLSQRIKSPTEMIEKMGEVDVEPKLDGLRILIHFVRGKFVKAFTRNLNETSHMFPELTKIAKFVNCDSVIFDCEAVGLDEKTKMMANFQTTMTRRRKHDIGEISKKVSIDFYIFDIISKNRKRIKEGYEGIMVKRVNSGYIPGRTGWRWVKMKQGEEAKGKLADTMDVVVMGYTVGRGKRVSFGVGQFLVGVRDRDRVLTTSKIGTGLTDEEFREIERRLKKLISKDKPKEYEVHKNYTPDYWVTPSLVVEIAADEITKSPTHTAGIALRFPRLVKF